MVYLIALATGGLLLLLSFVGSGDGGADADGGDAADGATGADAREAEIESEGGADESGHAGGQVLSILPLESLRFWTFFLAFGGLAGTLLSTTSALGEAATGACAGVVGYGTGLGVTLLMRWLARSQVSSTLGSGAYVGSSGTVVLPLQPGARGRVRLELENQTVDLDAETDDETLAASDPVFVYAVRGDGVVMVSLARAGRGNRPEKEKEPCIKVSRS
jgi:hypothetical protein